MPDAEWVTTRAMLQEPLSRLLAAFTVQDIARAAGVTRNTPRRWREGETDPRVRSLCRMTHGLGISIRSLYTGTPRFIEGGIDPWPVLQGRVREIMDEREDMSLRTAARVAGISDRTVRRIHRGDLGEWYSLHAVLFDAYGHIPRTVFR